MSKVCGTSNKNKMNINQKEESQKNSYLDISKFKVETFEKEIENCKNKPICDKSLSSVNTSGKILGNIASIESTGFVDGPGVRVVVFMQGCPLRCLYCHNPEDAFFNIEKNLMTAEDVLKRIMRYKPYFKNGGGVTFSGGEPLKQPEFLEEILKLCKKEGIHTAIDTSGYATNYEKVLDLVDLVILDVKAIESEEYKNITGRNIEVFNKFLSDCQLKEKTLWLRQVIVPGINDDKEHILLLKDYISKIKNVEKIELLPYHDMAKEKYKSLGLRYRLEDLQPMNKKKCQQLQKLLLSK